MEGTSKFAIRMALELVAMKLEKLDEKNRILGMMVGSKDGGVRKSMLELSASLNSELGEIRGIVGSALLVSKDKEPEV